MSHNEKSMNFGVRQALLPNKGKKVRMGANIRCKDEGVGVDVES